MNLAIHGMEGDIKEANTFYEDIHKSVGKFDFVISRAVTHFSKFCPWVSNKVINKSNHKVQNGIIALKGGDLKEEIQSIRDRYNINVIKLNTFFSEAFFESKQIIHLVKK